MPFPRKFKRLLEIEQGDVETPDYVWLTYAVCAVTPDACGWGGWMIEGAFKKTGEHHPTGRSARVAAKERSALGLQCGWSRPTTKKPYTASRVWIAKMSLLSKKTKPKIARKRPLAFLFWLAL